MKTLSIGQWVSFDGIAEAEYVGDERKIKSNSIERMTGVIVGKALRHEGTYNKGSSTTFYSSYGQELEDYEQASLSVGRVVKLWIVRTSWYGKPLEVFDEHVTPLTTESPNLLNHKALKPKRIIQVV